MIEAVPVPDRLEGAPASLRRRWSDEIKEQAVAESLVPGVNVSAIARRIGVDPAQLFCWRKAWRKSSISLVAPPQPDVSVEDKQTSSSVIEIVVGSIVIRADTTIDEAHLRRVLRAVRSA
ncbi:MAG: transposase [Methylovirgula sp.]